MKVSRLDSNGDWTFGFGLTNYAQRSEAIAQKVRSRLRSFKNDWFLDTEAEIYWMNLLGQRNNENIITAEVERVVLNTLGVVNITSFETYTQDRELKIRLSYRDVYGLEKEIEEVVR